MRRNKNGFTIVELLIVIVVIAILAAIAIVAYMGVQERARTSAVSSAVNQWIKVLKLNQASGSTGLDESIAGCLGSSAQDFPATDGFAAGECNDGGGVTYNEDSFSNWPAGISRPKGALPITTVKDSSGAIVRVRGVMHWGSNTIIWAPQIAGQCAPGQPTSTESNTPGSLDGEFCMYTLQD